MLSKKGLNVENILEPPKYLMYFKPPTPRLKAYKKSLFYIGPLAYNHFCNKVNKSFLINNSKLLIENLTPKSFTTNIKKYILIEQKLGNLHTWEPQNMPMYKLSSQNIVLRSTTISI